MGRVYHPSYTMKAPDGQRVEKTVEAWYIEYTDARGKTVRRKAGLTRKAAEDALRKAEGDVLAEKNGLPVQRLADMSCARLVEEYLAEQARRVNADHVVSLRYRLEAVLAGILGVYLSWSAKRT